MDILCLRYIFLKFVIHQSIYSSFTELLRKTEWFPIDCHVFLECVFFSAINKEAYDLPWNHALGFYKYALSYINLNILPELCLSLFCVCDGCLSADAPFIVKIQYWPGNVPDSSLVTVTHNQHIIIPTIQTVNPSKYTRLQRLLKMNNTSLK